MSIGTKIAHQAEVAKGSAKKTLGRVIGNSSLEREGHLDVAKGKTKQTAGRIKNVFKH